ncbi:MAG: hypothetical protein Q9224_001526 [Gallowayella concinna]
MPSVDSPAILCARFLQANGYNDTLQAFLGEAGLPPDAGSLSPGDLTIEKVLEEKKVFDLSLNFERYSISKVGQDWSLPGTKSVPPSFSVDLFLMYCKAPEHPWTVASLPSSSNLLYASVEDVRESVEGEKRQILFASTADRRLHLIDPNVGFPLLKSLVHIHDSPILACIVLSPEGMVTITTSMSGQVILYDHRANRVLDERRDHKKYVVKAAQFRHEDTILVATAGWDALVFLYRVRGGDTSGTRSLGEPAASLSLATNPETITFIKYSELNRPVLLVTRRDSTLLHYYSCEADDTSVAPTVSLRLLGSQNLAPHSNAWMSFSISAVAVSPKDPQILAIATSTVPHIKLIIVRMLVPSVLPSTSETITGYRPATQASQTRLKLAIEDQEDTAILLNVNTFAPQTPYSTPQVSWRPDGSGVWVNGDDGVIRGFEATTGKICSTLKEGHEPGSKIRSMWAGMVDVGGQDEEWVISGGFDKRLLVWKPGEDVRSVG